MTKFSILVVEDDPVALRRITKDLEGMGAEVHAFDGIIAAMKYISSKRKIDLIVTDIKLPYSSGIEFIHDLREKEIIIPYIIVSGSMDKNIFAKAMKMGCKGFFVKPYDKLRLLETVEKLVA